MDVWITYRLIGTEGPSREGGCVHEEVSESHRELFTFPAPNPPGFDLNGSFFSYGPSIGQMIAAIRQRHNDCCESVILKTEFGDRPPSD